MFERARIDETLDGLDQRDEGADEDRQHDRKASPALAPGAPEIEGDAERHRSKRIAEVVDQVGQERDAQRLRIDEALDEGREHEHAETPGDGADACAGPKDRAVDSPWEWPCGPCECVCK